MRTNYVAIGVLMKDNQVLMLQRKDKSTGLNWCFPAGGVETYDKSVDKAVEREMLEETGVACRAVQRLGEKPHPRREGIMLEYWACEYVSGEAQLMEPDQHDDVRWMMIDEAVEHIGPGLTSFVRNYLLPEEGSNTSLSGPRPVFV